MVNNALCNAKTKSHTHTHTQKSAAGVDQDCFYQLPGVIYFSVPTVCLDGFLGS